MKRLIPIVVLSPLIVGASLTPAWADAETVNPAAIFDSNSALDASSLRDEHTGLAPAPGSNDEEELRRKRPGSAGADPLKATRGADLRPRESDLRLSESDLGSPFTVNRTLNGSPINQQPTQNPPAATNPPPVANNPPPVVNNPPAANNPPPAQNTIPIANNSSLGSVFTDTSSIGSGVITTLRRDGLLR